MSSNRKTGLNVAALVALAFGALTILSGGRALFGGVEARAAMGDVVPFVLWFNFVAGFVYVMAGIGLFLRHPPAVWISIAIAASTALVGLALGYHVLQGGAFEMRTVAAMALRTGVWVVIATVAWRHMRQPQPV